MKILHYTTHLNKLIKEWIHQSIISLCTMSPPPNSYCGRRQGMSGRHPMGHPGRQVRGGQHGGQHGQGGLQQRLRGRQVDLRVHRVDGKVCRMHQQPSRSLFLFCPSWLTQLNMFQTQFIQISYTKFRALLHTREISCPSSKPPWTFVCLDLILVAKADPFPNMGKSLIETHP